jgi:hypothetical protein
MHDDPLTEPESPSLREQFRAWRKKVNENHTASFWLLLAIILVMALGPKLLPVDQDPRQYALFLGVNLVFFLVVFVRAVYDAAEIASEHIRERERVYRDTLGDQEFARELGRRVRENLDTRR